jgi:hypothetical protein
MAFKHIKLALVVSLATPVVVLMAGEGTADAHTWSSSLGGPSSWYASYGSATGPSDIWQGATDSGGAIAVSMAPFYYKDLNDNYGYCMVLLGNNTDSNGDHHVWTYCFDFGYGYYWFDQLNYMWGLTLPKWENNFYGNTDYGWTKAHGAWENYQDNDESWDNPWDGPYWKPKVSSMGLLNGNDGTTLVGLITNVEDTSCVASSPAGPCVDYTDNNGVLGGALNNLGFGATQVVADVYNPGTFYLMAEPVFLADMEVLKLEQTSISDAGVTFGSPTELTTTSFTGANCTGTEGSLVPTKIAAGNGSVYALDNFGTVWWYNHNGGSPCFEMLGGSGGPQGNVAQIACSANGTDYSIWALDTSGNLWVACDSSPCHSPDTFSSADSW